MLPAIGSGDSISVHLVDLADVQPGEVVAFVRDRHIVVHRFVRRTLGVDGVRIVTRGDACFHNDLPVSRDEFLGVVARVAHVGQDRPRNLAPAALRGLARLIRRPGPAHRLARRALASVAKGIALTHAFRNAP